MGKSRASKEMMMMEKKDMKEDWEKYSDLGGMNFNPKKMKKSERKKGK